MKKIILIGLLFITKILAQSGYTVEIEKTDQWWASMETWQIFLKAHLFYNGNPIANSQNYYYYWEVKTRDTLSWRFFSGSGLGVDSIYTDETTNYTLYVRLMVTDTVNQTFTDIRSNTMSYYLEGTPKIVFFEARKENGGTLPGVQPNHWRYTIGKWKSNFDIFLTLDYNEVIKSFPYFVESGNNKFYYWNQNTSDIQNYNSFYISTSTDSIISWYKAAKGGIQIRTLVDGNNGYKVFFKDPWVVNTANPEYYQSPYGYRNLGMSAPFDSVDSPLNLTFQSNHQGVFLNQNPNFLPDLPIYSVQAPLTPTINGANAFFTGWTTSNATLQQVDPNPSGYDQKAVVFTSDGATITANYAYTTVSTDLTIPSGTYTIADNLTVNSGVTLTVNSGTTLKFPSGSGLIVNGKLISNGATFTAASQNWKGITLNSAEGSSLQNCIISYALSPIVINSTNDISITGGTINNSSFYDNNPSQAAAIQVWGSSPTIFGVTISGQSNSWNGVRFADGSMGTLEECIIENLGYGNGVIVQGGSSPTVKNNDIHDNYYHGIIVNTNSPGSPLITGNSINYSGGTNNYTGIHFDASGGTVRYNSISNFHLGIWAYSNSTVYAGDLGETGQNTIYNNDEGLLATQSSTINFGVGEPQLGRYYGVCNNIYSNNLHNAAVGTSSIIMAEYNWWGQYPPDATKFYSDGSQYARVDWDNPEQYSGDCPIGNGALIIQASTTDVSGKDASTTLEYAIKSHFMNDYKTTAELCRNLLKKENIPTAIRKKCLELLYSVFQATGDESIANDLISFAGQDNELGVTAAELLTLTYAGLRRTSETEALANQLIDEHPNSEVEKRALLIIASLSAFDPNYRETSNNAKKVLAEKYGNEIDAGLMAALGIPVNKASFSISNNLEKKAANSANEVEKDNLSFGAINYPNPFNPATIITYSLPKASFVTLKVYNILGREITTLVNENKQAGKYEVTFDASELPSGIYFYRLTAGNENLVRKMLLVK